MSVPHPRILIVEDSPAMRQLLTLAVKRIPGALIQQAEDGVEALKLLKEKNARYDLVLLDLNMPVMDGMKLLSLIHRDPKLNPRGVCVVTTEHGKDTEVQARALGATHFLRKPVNRRQIEIVLAEVLNLGE